jgi:hypothetical protein
MPWVKRGFVALLVTWQVLLSLLLTLGGIENRLLRAMAGMLWGLNVLWIGGAGLFTLWGRDRIRDVFRQPPRYFGLKFILLFTLLALIEEAIATLMTNCAPLFGVSVGEVYITASADYLDVVVFHSVVVFLPQFATWAWLLSRYAFSPFAVFVLFGLTGLINETLFAGPQLLTVAQWMLVYGLMAYLPAYCYPELPNRRPVRWWHYPAAVILPIIAALPMVALLLLVIAPGHPSIHFPPMGAK